MISCCTVTSDNSPIIWEGEPISSKIGKFYYGEHEVLKYVNENITFLHVRDSIVYTIYNPIIKFKYDPTYTQPKIRFKWKTYIDSQYISENPDEDIIYVLFISNIKNIHYTQEWLLYKEIIKEDSVIIKESIIEDLEKIPSEDPFERMF